MHERLHGPIRYAAVTAAILFLGWLGGMAASHIVATTGDHGPSIAQSQSPGLASLIVVVFLVISAIVAGLLGRLTNAAVGMFVLGCGLYALAFRTGGLEALAFSPKPSWAL